MTIRRFARRRQQVTTFAAVGTVLLVPTTLGVRSLFASIPLWMAAIVALYPTFVIVGTRVAVANRCGWLHTVPADHGPYDGDADRTPPRWVSWAGNIVGFGLFFGFGDSWHDHWHNVYPNAPGWLLDAVILMLAVLASVVVEAALAEVVERARRKRVAARHEPHSPATNYH